VIGGIIQTEVPFTTDQSASFKGGLLRPVPHVEDGQRPPWDRSLPRLRCSLGRCHHHSVPR
jgi:hypothetical protein